MIKSYLVYLFNLQEPEEEKKSEEKMNSPLISMAKTRKDTIAAVKNDSQKMVKNDPKKAQEPDFFADMQPVIEATNEILISAPAHDKFAVILDEVDNDEDGWNDVNDDAWS